MSWLSNLFRKKSVPSGIKPLVPLVTIELPPNENPVELYQDQVLRKAWAEDVLAEQGIPINTHLPCIEGQAEAKIRSPREVADRLLALTIVAVKGEGLAQEDVLVFIEERGVGPLLTPKERAFIDNPEPTDHERAQFSWQYECAWVLLWALNFLDGPLEFPGSICDVPKLVETVRDSKDLTLNGLHSANNILNEADLIYRYHWAVRQAQIDGAEAPGGLEPGVVQERHRALNWLVTYMDQDWDDVSTDT